MSNENIPHFGSLATFCRIGGFSRSLGNEMKAGDLLVVVTIDNRDWIDIPATLKRLHDAAASGQSITIPGPHRQAELKRKEEWRQARRAAARALGKRNRRRSSDPAAKEIAATA
jgi:hypothetical protein